MVVWIIGLSRCGSIKATGLRQSSKENFPKPTRGYYSSTKVLKGDVIIGSLIEKTSAESLPIYLRLNSGTAGTMERRFWIAGVDDDAVILNASQQFLAAVANDDQNRIVQMIRFPLVFVTKEIRTSIQTSKSFLEQYDVVIDAEFRSRLAKTFPNYLIAEAGNFIGTISQSVYGGGGISFDEKGRVTAIYNWQTPEPTPTPTSASGGTK